MLTFMFCSLAAVVLAPLAGRYMFRKRVARDVTTLLSTTMSSVGPQQLAARRDSLPEPVRRYLRFAIEDGAPATRTVRLEHGGPSGPSRNNAGCRFAVSSTSQPRRQDSCGARVSAWGR
jgi:uncharacterized protein DUF6544